MLDALQTLFSPPDSSLLYVGRYDPLLVSLSIAVAIIASYAALLIAQQVSTRTIRAPQRLWILLGGLCMGSGIWTMHFVGMLAFSLPCATSYLVSVTLLSMVPGMLASTLALNLISQQTISPTRLLYGGLLLGTGIGTMHYTGMAAMRLDGLIRYNVWLFFLSILVAILMATLALWIKFRMQRYNQGSRALGVSSIIMGLAMSLMHYTAMGAAYFVRDGSANPALEASITPALLASVIVAFTIAIIGIMLLGTLVSRPQARHFIHDYRMASLFIPVWGLLAWWVSGYYSDQRAQSIYEAESSQTQRRVDELVKNIDATLELLRIAPVALANDALVRLTLVRLTSLDGNSLSSGEATAASAQQQQRWQQDSQLAQLSASLDTMAALFKAEVIFILNAAGDCIAASHPEAHENLVGTSHQSHHYFLQARAGKSGQSYGPDWQAERPGLIYSSPVYHQGAVVGVVVVKRPLSALAHSIDPYDAFLSDNHDVIVLAKDQNLQLHTLSNKAMANLSEQARQAQYGQTSLLPLPLHPWGDQRFPDLLRRANQDAPLLLRAKAMRDDALVVHVLRLIPELNRVAAERRWLFVLLVITGGTLIFALETLALYLCTVREGREMAEAANRAKSAFVANISHEILTPMNTIIGMTYLVFKTELTVKQREYLDKIQESSRHLLSLINDILDFSKIEAGKLSIESHEFDLDNLFDTVVHQLGDKAGRKGLELLFDIAPDVPRLLVGDSLRLGQILLHLGDNAVKFTEQGEVNIAVRVQEQGEHHVVLHFSVRDTGLGLSVPAQSRLFQSFQQADTSITRKYSGAGLGLAICKRIVERMGGAIGVESAINQGSLFWFTVRFELGEHARRRTPTPADLRGRRILVVDDSDSACDVIANLLRSMVFSVDTASSGPAALVKLASAAAINESYEVVFLDWQMPDMDGITTARNIRALGLKHPPRIVMLTAFGREEVIEAALGVGIVEVLAKPATASSLLNSILSALNVMHAGLSAFPAVAEGVPALADLAGARILLVEDNEVNQIVATEILLDAGFSVDIAEDGAVAVNKVQQHHYDLVLMDIQMPVMDGLTATREIRKQLGYENLPIIAMTANTMAGDSEGCLEAGMNGHIPKPIDLQELWDALRRWIKPKPKQTPLSLPRQLQTLDVPAVNPLSLRSIPGLDVTTGIQLVMGREKLYCALLRKFIAGEYDFANRLDVALDAGDWTTAERLAHTLKGSAAQIGAYMLQDRAERLEQSIRRREARELLALQQVGIAAHLTDLINALVARLPDESSSAPLLTQPLLFPEAIDRKHLRDLCTRLENLLAEDDYASAQLLRQYEPLLRTGLGRYFPPLAEAVSNFNFPAALEALKAAIIDYRLKEPD